MRAVAKLAKAEASVGVIDAPEPEAGPGEALIRVSAAEPVNTPEPESDTERTPAPDSSSRQPPLPWLWAYW